jgi:HD-like signal output (HDOD) protein/GGDEF domain-containing protein
MIDQVATTDLLQRFVDRAGSLYSLPAVAMEVLELTSQPGVDARALKECVERDPALTGKLLRVVNSPMFGLTREVCDLNQALALLGVKPLKLLALGFSLPKGLFSGIEARALEHYWQYTLLKAVAARELCQVYWKGAGDEAFIAGLLQEIGILVLVQELGDSYLNFLHSVREQGADLVMMERETLGFDHVALSARLLDHWNLPTQIVDAVAAPPDCEQLAHREADESPLPQILHLATLIASVIVDGQQHLMPELLKTANRYRGLTVEQIDRLLDQMQERVELMANVFAVRLELQASYREILARAHAQMSQVAVDAVPDMVGHGERCAGAAERQALSRAIDRFTQGLAPLPVGTERRQADAARQTAAAGPRWHDPGLFGRVEAAIAGCWARQHEMSLILLELDNYAQLLISVGPERLSQIIAAMPDGMSALCDVPYECLLIREARYAILLPDCDRQQAVAVARSLVDHLPDWLLEQTGLTAPLALIAGVAALAAAGRNSHPEDLINAAERCLFAAKSSGGRVVKSIDVLG